MALFRDALNLTRGRIGTLLATALVPYIVTLTVPILIGSIIGHLVTLAEKQGPSGLWAGMSPGAKDLIVFAYTFYACVPYAIAQAGLFYVISESVKGRPVSALDALKKVGGYLPRLVVIGLATGALVYLGTCLFVLAGLIALAVSSFVAPVAVLENLPVAASFRRSYAISAGQRMKIIGLYLLFILFWVLTLLLLLFVCVVKAIGPTECGVGFYIWIIVAAGATIIGINSVLAVMYLERIARQSAVA